MTDVDPPDPGSRRAVVSLKVTLRGTKPPVWRRLLVSGSMNLGTLHDVIQRAMGWHDAHLHGFDVGGDHFGDPRQLEGAADENRMTLNRLVKAGVKRFAYTYDYGDNWQHALLIEKVTLTSQGGTAATCIAGRRQCPPEDCGGVWGYADLLADPSRPDDESDDILADGFDPEAFSLEDTNARLVSLFAKRTGNRGIWTKV